jgi:hypothetical protein
MSCWVSTESWVCVYQWYRCMCTHSLACVLQTEVGKMDYPVPDDVRKQLLENPVPVCTVLHYAVPNMFCVLTSA